MFASLRTYRIGSGSVDAVMRRVDRDFARALAQEPGFIAYHAIETSNGTNPNGWSIDLDHVTGGEDRFTAYVICQHTE